MNPRSICRAMLAIFISVSLIACKEKGKSEETTTDSTKITQPTNNTAFDDAVKASPNLYKTLVDSLGIRIVEVNYKSGDSSSMHWHPDHAVYAIAASKARFYHPDGSSQEIEMPAGVAFIRPSESHSVKNTGTGDIKVILFEVNRKGQATLPEAASDVLKVAPAQYKLIKDTLGIRLLEVNVKAGESLALHSHPDGALYAIEGGTIEFTGKDGQKTVAELKKGMGLVTGADTHSVKNTGRTTVKGILVEVYRGM